MAGQGNQAQNPQPIPGTVVSLLPLLPKFFGTADEDFSDFVSNFDEITLATGIANEQKARLLPLRLENYAKSTWKNLPEHIRTSYDRSVAQLHIKFVHSEQLAHTSSQLMNRVQNSEESISEYAYALCTLGGRCYSDLTIDALNKVLLGIFVNGIHQKYSLELVLKNPQTLDNAITAAQQIESALSNGGSLIHTGLESTTKEGTSATVFLNSLPLRPHS